MCRLPVVYGICLHGKISAISISNFLSVYRVRPCDPNDDARSDGDFSDEELVLIEVQLEQALKNRVGGQHRR